MYLYAPNRSRYEPFQNPSLAQWFEAADRLQPDHVTEVSSVGGTQCSYSASLLLSC